MLITRKKHEPNATLVQDSNLLWQPKFAYVWPQAESIGDGTYSFMISTSRLLEGVDIFRKYERRRLELANFDREKWIVVFAFF